MKTPVQSAQEAEYCFPYHYVSIMPNQGFAQHYVDSWAINYISTIEFIIENIMKQNTPRSLVDIGCGDGRLAREIGLAISGCKITGIDYSQRAINLAKAMNPDLEQIQFQSKDITSHEINEKHDIAILMEVFEHIPLDKTNEFLKGVRSCLKSDGVLFLTVPHVNKPVEYKHFQHFSFGSLREHLEPHFNIVEMVPFEKKGVARRMLNLLLHNRFYVLNNKRLLSYLYKLHRKFLFVCQSEDQCQRIFVKATPIPQ